MNNEFVSKNNERLLIKKPTNSKNYQDWIDKLLEYSFNCASPYLSLYFDWLLITILN